MHRNSGVSSNQRVQARTASGGARVPIACGLNEKGLEAVLAASPANARFDLVTCDGTRFPIGRGVDKAALRWLAIFTAPGSGNRLDLVLARTRRPPAVAGAGPVVRIPGKVKGKDE